MVTLSPHSVRVAPSPLTFAPPRSSRTRQSTLCATTRSCTTLCTQCTSAPWWYAQEWTTASPPSLWTWWMRWTAGTRCCFWGQVSHTSALHWLGRAQRIASSTLKSYPPLISDRGTVQKVIVLPKDPSTLEELILEEVDVFRVIIITYIILYFCFM